MLRTVLSVCLALLFSAAVFAQEAVPAARANDDSAQLQSLEQETQLQMRALEEQRATAGAQDAEVIEERGADLKFQYEIRRLTILLEQAEAHGDEARGTDQNRWITSFNAASAWLGQSAGAVV